MQFRSLSASGGSIVTIDLTQQEDGLVGDLPSELDPLCSLKETEEVLRGFNRELDRRVADRTRELEALYAIPSGTEIVRR